VKNHPLYVCRSCGARAARWQGRCTGYAQWNTLDEVAVAPTRADAPVTTPLRLVETAASAAVPSGVAELDRVLGGGLVPGSTTLLFGEPGVGKSTPALSVLREWALAGRDVVLVAAEESATQVAGRARRLGAVPAGLHLATTTLVDEAEALIRAGQRALVVVDSISAMSDASLAGAVGSVPQVRQAAERLCGAAKAAGTALVLVGHVTKDGELAGPRALEHLVDTVVRIEGDRHGSLRIVRALKHRFGPTGEVGLFEMDEGGMRQLDDAARLLGGPRLDVPGVVLTVTNDGSRSFPVEVQALVARSSGPTRRVAHQVSAQRLSLLLAVLESRCGVDTAAFDVFAATAGGLAATEPGVDVALALAVASAARGFAVPASLVAIGEVGLAGELRAVGGLARRVREAARLGATVVVVPAEGEAGEVAGVEVRRCRSLSEALAAAQPVTNQGKPAKIVNPPNAR
jgi:DNA repair protein RadA/Sms